MPASPNRSSSSIAHNNNNSSKNANSLNSLKVSENKLSTGFKILLYLGDAIILGFSFVLFIIGVLYLSAYGYGTGYTFTSYSPTLLAGFYIAIGVVVFFLAVANIISLLIEKSIFFLFSSLLFIICFLILIILGIYGLAVVNNGQLQSDIFNGMKTSLSCYQEANTNKEDTARINWLQSTYRCCGIYTPNDWNLYYTNCLGNLAYTGNAAPSTSANSLVTVNYVPDSCCITPAFNCGKLLYNSYSSQNPWLYIYTTGCLNAYDQKVAPDVTVLAALALTIGIICLLITFLFIAILICLRIRNKD